MFVAPRRRASRVRGGVLILLGGVLLAACSGATSSPSASPASPPSEAASVVAASSSPVASPSVTSPSPAASPSTAASPSSAASAVPTSYDPCQLVTAAEASTLTGATFSSGDESTTAGGGKLCSYSQEGVVFEVLVAQSKDAATAQAEEPSFKAELEQGVSQAGIVNPTLTELPGFESGVDAAVVEGSASLQGQTIGGIAIYALKGAVFVAISDVQIGGSLPSSDAMQAQAHTTLARIS